MSLRDASFLLAANVISFSGVIPAGCLCRVLIRCKEALALCHCEDMHVAKEMNSVLLSSAFDVEVTGTGSPLNHSSPPPPPPHTPIGDPIGPGTDLTWPYSYPIFSVSLLELKSFIRKERWEICRCSCFPLCITTQRAAFHLHGRGKVSVQSAKEAAKNQDFKSDSCTDLRFRLRENEDIQKCLQHSRETRHCTVDKSSTCPAKKVQCFKPKSSYIMEPT